MSPSPWLARQDVMGRGLLIRREEKAHYWQVVAPEVRGCRKCHHLPSFLVRRVAAYMYPRYVHLVDSLPKGSTGKILKREMRLASFTYTPR